MASSHVYDSIKSALQAEFGGTYPILDDDEVDPAIEQGEAPFLSLQEASGTEELTGMGDPAALCVEETSYIIVRAFTPSPHANAAVRSILDAVNQSLRFRTFNGVHVVAVSPPDMVQSNNGLWTEGASLLDLSYHSTVDSTQ